MLASIPRAAPAAARRLTTATALRAPLAPPYSHSVRPALAPPYTHPLAHVPEEQRLQAPYAFSLLREHVQVTPPTREEFVAAILDNEAGREWAQAEWTKALAELAEQPATPPEISFQALTAVLSDPNVRDAVIRAGGVVIRDVVRDSSAEFWAQELTECRRSRDQLPTFHHPAQVAARADPSVLSATSTVLRNLLPGVGSPEGSFVRVDAASTTPSKPTWTGKSLWTVEDSSAPGTPLHAHLALSRTEVTVPTSSAAATYALLRPFFSPKASRISFYSPAGYLAAENWTLCRPGQQAAVDAELVHVRPANVSLAPGDVLVTHAGLQLGGNGLVLPCHPLPVTEGNKAYIALQRASFEAGLPPPHVCSNGSPVALEEAGDASMIESWGGRRAMGYGF